MSTTHDAIVVGSGPNGLAAAIALARRGLRVLVREANATAGGGVRSAELTRPGFVHDLCSAIHPMAVASPFLRELPLRDHGLDWVTAPAGLAHPFDDGSATMLFPSIEKTAAGLGADAARYRDLMQPLADAGPALFRDLMGPPRWPTRLWTCLRFAWQATQSAEHYARRSLTSPQARALFTGLAAHAILPLEHRPSVAFGVMLALAAHAVDWPMPRGGAQRLTDSMVSYLRSLGGEVVTDRPVETLDEFPSARAFLLDTSPREAVRLAGDRISPRMQKRLARFRHGPGVFKVDWALREAIPWRAKDCAAAASVHLGGTFEEVLDAERQVWAGQHAARPFIILAQPTLFDPTRAPAGQHVAWAYCHVPAGSTVDMTAAIEAQIERFAPGFRDVILDRHTMNCAAMERSNRNHIGGEIAGGVCDFAQLLARPVLSSNPYRLGKSVYLCSASTPPGMGVHGMGGYFAAEAALRDLKI